MKIGVAADHRGFNKKNSIVEYLVKQGHDVIDFGTDSAIRTDYPAYAFALGEAVANKTVDYGFIICATGIGVSIAANKVKGIRCAKVNNANEAKQAKQHNKANMLAFGSHTFTFLIKDMIDVFLKEKTSSNPRYESRNQQIAKYEGSK